MTGLLEPRGPCEPLARTGARTPLQGWPDIPNGLPATVAKGDSKENSRDNENKTRTVREGVVATVEYIVSHLEATSNALAVHARLMHKHPSDDEQPCAPLVRSIFGEACRTGEKLGTIHRAEKSH